MNYCGMRAYTHKNSAYAHIQHTYIIHIFAVV